MHRPLSIFLCCLPGIVAAAPVRTPHAEAELVAENTAIQASRPLTVALRLKAIPGWHTYWRNPGDAGLPTKLDWKLPQGFQPGPIQWPYPARLPAVSLVNYGYEGEVFLPVEIQVPAKLDSNKPVTLAARANWLVCSEESCIPERADLELQLPIGSGKQSTHARAIKRAHANLPVPAASLNQWHFTAEKGTRGPAIDVTVPSGTTLTALSFFPYEEGKIENSATQSLERTAQGYRLQLTTAQQPVGQLTHLRGTLVATPGFGQKSGEPQSASKAVEIDLPLTRRLP